MREKNCWIVEIFLTGILNIKLSSSLEVEVELSGGQHSFIQETTNKIFLMF